MEELFGTFMRYTSAGGQGVRWKEDPITTLYYLPFANYDHLRKFARNVIDDVLDAKISHEALF